MNFKKRVNGSWHDIPHYIHNTSTDTITTLPVNIYPNDTTATVGLKGNTVQSTTPTPQNPVMPQGTGERTGNLLQIPDVAETTKNGVTYHVRGNSLYINGTSTSAFGINIRNAFTLKAGTYTNQMYGFTGRRIYYSFNNVSTTMCASDVNLFKTFTISEDTTYANAMVWINNGVAFDNEKIDFALFESDTPKDFDVYGYKIPISSASTTTPVYLGEVEATRKIKKLVLTGNETFYKNDTSNPNSYLYYQTGGYRANEYCLCTHLVNMGTLSASKVGVFNGNNVLYLNFGSAIMNAQPSGNTVAGLKEYLAAQYAAGTPVTVWYVLSSATTGIVNEPLRKIGDYVDTVSGITIPTITGKDAIDVETTLKPSEVELTYTGWHDASVKERDGSDWQ